MKLSKKTVKLFLKCVVCVVLTCTFLVQVPFLSVWAVGEDTTTTTPTDMHQYQDGIIDGAVYYLRNVGNGGYLTVDNGDTCVFTTLSTAPLTNALYQQFIIEYTGSDLYRIQPRHAENVNDPYAVNGKMYLCVEGRDSEAWVSLYGYSQSGGDYLLQPCGGNQFVILSEMSNYTCALYPDSSSDNMLIQRTYNTMSDSQKNYARWEFVRVDQTYGSYEKYYIRNSSQNVYLDVTNPLALTLQAAPLNHQDTQQWKKINTNLDGYSYLSSMNDLYDYVGIFDDQAMTYSLQQLEPNRYLQYIRLQCAGYEGGNPEYYIAIDIRNTQNSITQTKYLSLGQLLDSVTDTYQVIFSDTPSSNSLWVFEQAYTSNDSFAELSLNTWYLDSLLDASDVKYFALSLQKETRYKIEIVGTNVVAGEITGDFTVTEINRETYAYSQTIDIFIDNHVGNKQTYYIPICYGGSDNPIGISFRVRVRELILVGHSVNSYSVTDPDVYVYFSQQIAAIQDSVEDMNYHFVHRIGLTASQALQSQTSITGSLDFNADIFVFTGHGDYSDEYDEEANNNNTWICYEPETDNVKGRLYSTQLPYMSNCELAVWLSCYSATSTPQNSSIALASYNNGAKTSIGFNSKTYHPGTQVFVDALFRYISMGQSIHRATINARTDLLNWGESDEGLAWGSDAPQKMGTMVESMRIFGDLNNVIYPTTSTGVLTSVSSESNIQQITYNRDDYTLLSDNIEFGVRRYVKMINGLETDDYFVEFYENGELVSVHKSRYTLTDVELFSAIAQLESYHDQCVTTQGANNNLYFGHVNGELQLLETQN